MILCIDCGNTRLKWAWHDGRQWSGDGAAPRAATAQLAGLVGAGPAPHRIMVANVAGDAVLAAVADALGGWRDRLVVARSTAAACGVTNGYGKPGSLGVDRWCALIGAWSLVGGACVVVGAGTATTIDSLDAGGRFRGGFILPGLDLMAAALAGNTAGLPRAAGSYAEFPAATEDAIYSGAVEATCGAVERACARLAGAPCLLFGGAAPHLVGRLGVASRSEPRLVLEGLHRLAREAA